MIVKRILICLMLNLTLIPLINAKNLKKLQSSSELMQKKSTQTLWTDAEVKALMDELNTLSESYIKEAWSAGWNSGYSEGFDAGKICFTTNPPFSLTARYCLFGFCTGICTATTTGLLLQLQL